LLIAAILILSGVLAFLAWLFLELQPPAPPQIGERQDEGFEWVRSIYGFGDSGDEQLYAPTSVAIGPQGNIYVTDPTRSRVLLFTPEGAYKGIVHTGVGGTGEGQFIRPESIDVDEQNQLYIADSWANKIVVYDVDGNYLREWPILGQARGVDVVGEEVFVLSMGRVFVFDRTGIPLLEFGRRGGEPGQIDAYQGVTADEERIYVADSFNRRIQAFDREGELVWARPLYGGESEALFAVEDTPSVEPTGSGGEEAGAEEGAEDGTDEFAWDLPQDLTFDAAGRLVVVDAFRFELVVVDPQTGDVIASHGGFGREDGSFYYPSSVAYDPSADWFAVADTENHRVQIVRVEGSGGGIVQVVNRLNTSPNRFVIYPLLVPLVLLLLILVVWLIRRIAGRRRAARLAAGAEDAVLLGESASVPPGGEDSADQTDDPEWP
jgi:DNA-binding beta-propeller fold protein YncE